MKFIALSLFVALGACSGGKDADEEETQEPGLACEDGGGCILGEEFCLIQDGSGVCTYIPDGCTADDGCDCEAASAACESDTGGGHSCFSFGTSITIECI